MHILIANEFWLSMFFVIMLTSLLKVSLLCWGPTLSPSSSFVVQFRVLQGSLFLLRGILIFACYTYLFLFCPFLVLLSRLYCFSPRLCLLASWCCSLRVLSSSVGIPLWWGCHNLIVLFSFGTFPLQVYCVTLIFPNTFPFQGVSVHCTYVFL